ncbi:MAG: hypothetical protein ABJB47_22870, partial [Actinomycetota bacterium]
MLCDDAVVRGRSCALAKGREDVAGVFERLVGVRWRDGDGLGHVNHAVFLTYLEEGRDAFFLDV